jgi:hypothetical protein
VPAHRDDLEQEWLAINKRRDRVIGILLGVLLGIAVVIVFVLFGSEETIDAPSIDRSEPAAERSAHPRAERR